MTDNRKTYLCYMSIANNVDKEKVFGRLEEITKTKPYFSQGAFLVPNNELFFVGPMHTPYYSRYLQDITDWVNMQKENKKITNDRISYLENILQTNFGNGVCVGILTIPYDCYGRQILFCPKDKIPNLEKYAPEKKEKLSDEKIEKIHSFNLGLIKYIIELKEKNPTKYSKKNSSKMQSLINELKKKQELIV